MSEDSDALNAVIAEYLKLAEAGLADRQDFINRHPGFRKELESFFACYQEMRRAVVNGVAAAAAAEPFLAPSPLRDLVEESLRSTHPGADLSKPNLPNLSSTRMNNDGNSGESFLELPRDFGDYELTELIARGGMGVVYKGRQKSLNRSVAVKMILAGQLAGAEEVERFRREAQAAGVLDHSGIVPIYEVGTHEGRHFFSMAYVDGNSLAEEIREGPFDERTAAQHVRVIADAVAYAHERGVVHRDIKPGNILVDKSGKLKITDFGLATRRDDTDGVTATGQILGTPAYMPPEQASGLSDRVGPLSDIYSIGALLYCLVTGRPPFQASHPIETLRQVIDDEPVSPRQLAPNLSRDLETICLKCLEKEPARRYESAKSLVDELDRYLTGRPIQAHPVGFVSKTIKLARRHRTVSLLFVVLAVSMLAGTAVSTWFALEAEARADAASIARTKATDLAKEKSLLVEQKTETIERLEDYLYVSRLREAQSALEAGEIDSCRKLLSMAIPRNGEPDRRCFAWRHLQHQLKRADPNTRELSGEFDNVKRGTIAVGSQGSRYAVAFRRTIWLGNFETNEFREAISDQEIADACFTKDNRYLAVALGAGGGTVARRSTSCVHLGIHLYDLESSPQPKLHLNLTDAKGSILAKGICVACSPTDPLFACGQAGGKIAIWNYETEKQVAILIPPDHDKTKQIDFEKLLFTPDGKKLVSLRFGHSIDLWDVAQGKHETRLHTYRTQIPFQSRYYRSAGWLPNPVALAITRDGKTLAAAGNGLHVKIINLDTGRIRQCMGHLDAVTSLAFLPDDKTLVSGSFDHQIRLWNAERQIELGVIGSHRASVHGVAVASDGRSVISSGSDNRLRRWQLPSENDPPDVLHQGNQVFGLVFRPGTNQLVASGWPTTGSTIEWNTDTGNRFPLNPKQTGRAYAVDVTPDGEFLVATNFEGQCVEVWDENQTRQIPVGFPVLRVTLHPKGNSIAVANKASAALFDFPNGQLIKKLEGSPRFSPDGQILVTVEEAKLKFWDATTWEPLDIPSPENVDWPIFSPDGRFIALRHTPTSFIVWDVESQSVLFEGEGHFSNLNSYAFAPDGKTVTTIGDDARVLLWDLRSGRIKAVLSGHTAQLRTVAFNSEGTILATAGIDGTIRLWRAEHE